MIKELVKKVRLTNRMRYRILRACGFKPRVAKYLLGLNCPDELLMEQTTAGLKKKKQKEVLEEVPF